jgi:hypothetical protein
MKELLQKYMAQVKLFISKYAMQEQRITELETKLKKLQLEFDRLNYSILNNAHEGRYTQQRRER